MSHLIICVVFGVPIEPKSNAGNRIYESSLSKSVKGEFYSTMTEPRDNGYYVFSDGGSSRNKHPKFWVCCYVHSRISPAPGEVAEKMTPLTKTEKTKFLIWLGDNHINSEEAGWYTLVFKR